MNIGPFQFSYNAVQDKGKRQAPQKRVKHEKDVLKPKDRKALQATVQDQLRNHSTLAWMVRKHLDYVSRFHISFRTGNDELDKTVARIFKWHGKPGNFDIAGRFGRNEMFRHFELEKVSSGDAGLIKLEGLKLQAVESDLIAKGTDAPDGVTPQGLVVDSAGTVLQYAVCNRGNNGATSIVHDTLIDRQDMLFDAYWTRFSSQFRGVSPLSTALNTVQDISEKLEFEALKGKMQSLFGVALMRDSDGTNGALGGAAGATSETSNASDTAADTELDLNPRQINILDLKSGERVELLESKSPNSAFVEGTFLYMQIAMLALDIPITCFDSRRSSFSARIADLNEYEVSIQSKRDKNRFVRQDYSDWVLEHFWNTPAQFNLQAAADGKMDLPQIQESVEWIPSGSPWLDKLKQIKGDQLGIELGLDNRIDAARRRGSNVFTNIDKEAQVQEYAASKGVTLTAGKGTDRTIGEEVTDAMNDNPEGTDQ